MGERRSCEKLIGCMKKLMLCLLLAVLFYITKTDIVHAGIYIGEPADDLTMSYNERESGENWTFDEKTSTLYLSGINAEGQLIYGKFKKLNIVVTGNNTVSWIENLGNIKISGNGTLTINIDTTAGAGKITDDEHVVWANQGDIELEDTTVDIHIKTARNWPMALCATYGKIELKNCNFSSEIYKSGKKHNGCHLDCREFSIINSNVKLSGTECGIAAFSGDKCSITNSSLEISASDKTAMGMQIGGESLEIKKSQIIGKSGRGFWWEPMNTTIKNSTVTAECTDSSGNYGAINVVGGLTAKMNVINSTLNATGNMHGMLILFTKKICLKGGMIHAVGKKGNGIEFVRESAMTIEKGTIKAAGKKYGLYTGLDGDGRLKVKGGKVILTGKKAACDNISGLPAGKSYVYKAGSKASKAKKVTVLKKSDKYIQIKKK